MVLHFRLPWLPDTSISGSCGTRQPIEPNQMQFLCLHWKTKITAVKSINQSINQWGLNFRFDQLPLSSPRPSRPSITEENIRTVTIMVLLFKIDRANWFGFRSWNLSSGLAPLPVALLLTGPLNRTGVFRRSIVLFQSIESDFRSGSTSGHFSRNDRKTFLFISFDFVSNEDFIHFLCAPLPVDCFLQNRKDHRHTGNEWSKWASKFDFETKKKGWNWSLIGRKWAEIQLNWLKNRPKIGRNGGNWGRIG